MRNTKCNYESLFQEINYNRILKFINAPEELPKIGTMSCVYFIVSIFFNFKNF